MTYQFLSKEREVLEKYMPGFREQVQSLPFSVLESRTNPSIRLFKQYKGAGLAIPKRYGGAGASPLELVHLQRALGALSPSLAVAINMHQFSVATLVEMALQGKGVEWMLLEAICKENLLVASGFAEGKSGASILHPYLTLDISEEGFHVSGQKKPCSLAHSMDLLTASVIVPGQGKEPDRLAVILIPADSPGLTVKPFWQSDILAGSESEEVVLNKVFIPQALVSYSGLPGELDEVQARGFIWFELLVTASYLGVASSLYEKVLHSRRGEAGSILKIGCDLELAATALEGIALAMEKGQDCHELLPKILMVRYGIQHILDSTGPATAEILGGMAYISQPEIAHLLAASKPLAFHPPSRGSMAQYLVDYLMGQPLKMC